MRRLPETYSSECPECQKLVVLRLAGNADGEFIFAPHRRVRRTPLTLVTETCPGSLRAAPSRPGKD